MPEYRTALIVGAGSGLSASLARALAQEGITVDSGDIRSALDTIISEMMTLQAKHLDELTLSADAPLAVAFGGVASANLVILKATSGGPVNAIVTSASGASQAIPFDTYLILMTNGIPITALSLQRQPATLTVVEVLLGQKA